MKNLTTFSCFLDKKHSCGSFKQSFNSVTRWNPNFAKGKKKGDHILSHCRIQTNMNQFNI